MRSCRTTITPFFVDRSAQRSILSVVRYQANFIGKTAVITNRMTGGSERYEQSVPYLFRQFGHHPG
jgi:hypothetical protein